MNSIYEKVKAVRLANSQPITKKSSKENLIKIGVLTKDGKIASAYKDIIIKTDGKRD